MTADPVHLPALSHLIVHNKNLLSFSPSLLLRGLVSRVCGEVRREREKGGMEGRRAGEARALGYCLS